jgi:negative regulator of sigma E activity
MTRRPFEPGELDEPLAYADRAITELERYVMTSDTDAPPDLSDRIMAAVEREPAPHRGFFAWLASPAAGDGGAGRLLRVGAVAATLVLAVAGALFAGQLADIVRNVGGPTSPSPSVSPSPSFPASTTPGPSLSEAATPSATPEASDDHGGAAPTGQPTPQQTANATPEDTAEETKTPRPSATATASPSATPTQTP